MIYEWIVYKTVNLINNHIYIGVHKTKVGIYDGYIGNDIYKDEDAVKNYAFHRAVKKYGYKNFKRETLFTYPDSESGKLQAYKKEAELVNREFLKRKDVYNMVLGGKVPSSANEREVAQYDLNGNFIAVYQSLIYATSITGEPKSSIQHCCSKKTYSGKYQWRYFTGNSSNIDAANLKNKTVYQFDLKGNYITYYKSVTDAAKSVNTRESNISAVCLGNRTECKSFYWSYKKQFNYNPPSNKCIKVACYDDFGNLLCVYDSLRDAERKSNISRKLITNCIKGKSKHAGKVRWRYFDGDTSNINSLKIKI